MVARFFFVGFGQQRGQIVKHEPLPPHRRSVGHTITLAGCGKPQNNHREHREHKVLKSLASESREQCEIQIQIRTVSRDSLAKSLSGCGSAALRTLWFSAKNS